MVTTEIEWAIIKWKEARLPEPDSIIMPPRLVAELIHEVSRLSGTIIDVSGDMKYMGLDILESNSVKNIRVAKTKP